MTMAAVRLHAVIGSRRASRPPLPASAFGVRISPVTPPVGLPGPRKTSKTMTPRPLPLVDDDVESSTGSIGEDMDAYSTSSGTGSGTGHGGALSESSHGNLRDKIIKKEEVAVRKTRIAASVVLLICAASVSTAVYLFAKNAEMHHFTSEFETHAKAIVSMVQWDIQNNFALMQQVSAAMTSSAVMTNASLPFFTHSSFEVPAGYADGMGGIMGVMYAPRVMASERQEWETYSLANQGWLVESERLREVHPNHRDAVHGTFQDHEHDRHRLQEVTEVPDITGHLWHWESATKVKEPVRDDYYPVWQTSPPDATPVNSNLMADPTTKALYDSMLARNGSVLNGYTQINELWDWMFDPEEKVRKTDPHLYLMEPVYATYDTNATLVGVLSGLISWANILNRLLDSGENGIVCVIKDACGMDFTYVLNGQWATFLGVGDLHDSTWDEYKRSVQLELYEAISEDMCIHDIHVYPTVEFQSKYLTKQPWIFTSVVLLAFAITACVFFVFDYHSTQRQNKTMDNAIRTNQVVASLFPANVRDRLMEDAEQHMKTEKLGKLAGLTRKAIDENQAVSVSRPIADFFPEVTVLFADIAGFTAWSSTREPFQVFQLLETIYGALDEVAKRRRVFKVETVGDCYVAVAGMPDPCKSHAVILCRFARDCIFKMNEYSRKLETTLGPDTADLQFRIGLHSGAVTAGVLRGQNARFQLFGDTMNLASRVESTGLPGRVQISKTTADLLTAAGKAHWFKPREEVVHAKGKGEIETFWLLLNAESVASSASGSVVSGQVGESRFDQLSGSLNQPQEQHPSGHTAKDQRLIEWNVSVLLQRVRALVAERDSIKPDDVVVPDDIAAQLGQYVAGIASMYRECFFHGFEHGSHVTMSVTKLLSRIVGGELDCGGQDVNCYTKDITSDGLTKLAAVFSALIHDADHQGVPNAQLVKEGQAVAQIYGNQSVAERNSIAISWDYFMMEEFKELRDYICPLSSELERFKELVNVCVLATDIADKDLKDDRNLRWAKVFDKSNETPVEQLNHLKAQIVLEHLIQASDICHTMQHWHIYMKWNERFFRECYQAYIDGRADKNPADYWYDGECGFFDYYIIPLAQKLYECGVFGVSSDEFLNYARHNRHEWELKGREVVAQYVEKYCKPEHVVLRKQALLQTATVASPVTPKRPVAVVQAPQSITHAAGLDAGTSDDHLFL